MPGKECEMTRVFLRSQPQSLGLVQIFVGLMCVLAGLTAIIPSQPGHAPLFLGAAFVLSGSLCVAARRGTSLGLIRGTLAVNIISAAVSLAVIGYLCVLLPTTFYQDGFCGRTDNATISNSRESRKCMWMDRQLRSVLAGVRGLLLALTALECCASVTICVFSAKALRQRGSGARQAVVLVDGEHAQVTTPR